MSKLEIICVAQCLWCLVGQAAGFLYDGWSRDFFVWGLQSLCWNLIRMESLLHLNTLIF